MKRLMTIAMILMLLCGGCGDVLWRCGVCQEEFAKPEQIAEHINSHIVNIERVTEALVADVNDLVARLGPVLGEPQIRTLQPREKSVWEVEKPLSERLHNVQMGLSLTLQSIRSLDSRLKIR